MYNAPYQGVANNLAQYGRFGDSQLVHMNPIEVQMLSRLSPTGQLTMNPMTGQPEAFLPFLAPLLGSFLGSSLLTGAGAGILGAAGLSSAAAGAIGSGLATAAVTGDLEQGILSGITGFGLGQAFGAAGDALSKAGADTATQAATQAATQGVTDAATAGVPDVLSQNFQITPQGFASQGIPAGTDVLRDSLSIGPEGFTAAAGANAPAMSALTGQPMASSLGGGMRGAIQPPGAPPLTAAQRLSAPFQEPGAFLSQLSSPGSFLPMYVGETGRMARQQEIAGQGSARAFEEEQEAEKARIRGQMGDVFNQIRSAYPGVGYAKGGKVEGYIEGGYIESAAEQAARNALYNSMIPAAENVQLSLRGQYALTPPSASYSALDVGGEGYMPGMAPEFRYFTDVDPNAPAAPTGPGTGVAPPTDDTIPGGTAGSQYGGFNLGEFLSNYGNLFGGYRNLFGGGAGAGADAGAGAGTGVGDVATTPETAGSVASSFDPALLEEILSKQFNPLTERLNQIETRIGEPSGSNAGAPIDLSQFEDRFSNLENLLSGVQRPVQPVVDFTPLEERLAGLEGRLGQSVTPAIDLSGLETRLGGLENRLGNLNIAPPQVDLSGLESRFSGLEERLGNLNVTQPPVDLSGLEQRLGGLEGRLGNLNFPTTDLSGLEQRLGGLEGRLGNLNVPQVDLSGLEQRLGGLEQGLGALRSNTPAAPDLSGIYDRFGELETRLSNLPQPTAPVIDLSPIEQRLASIESRGPVSFDPILERLSALETLLANQQRGMGGLNSDSMQLGEFGGFAEGGMTSSPEPMDIPADPRQLLRLTVAAIRGEVEGADQVIRAFVEQFGSDMFMQLREQVLQDIVPGAQTEGMVQGNGGGQDDLVNGMIGNQRPVAVSPGEYIIPADVVALAGGGYSGDGANFFDGLVDDIRQKTMGTTEQVRPYRRSA